MRMALAKNSPVASWVVLSVVTSNPTRLREDDYESFRSTLRVVLQVSMDRVDTLSRSNGSKSIDVPIGTYVASSMLQVMELDVF